MWHRILTCHDPLKHMGIICSMHLIYSDIPLVIIMWWYLSSNRNRASVHESKDRQVVTTCPSIINRIYLIPFYPILQVSNDPCQSRLCKTYWEFPIVGSLNKRMDAKGIKESFGVVYTSTALQSLLGSCGSLKSVIAMNPERNSSVAVNPKPFASSLWQDRKCSSSAFSINS